MRDYILEEYEELLKVVTELTGDYQKAVDWMASPNPSLDGKTPAALIIDGNGDKLRRLIFLIANRGQYAA